MSFASLLFGILSLLAPEPEATLVFAGDAMMHQGQIDAAYRTDGSYDFGGYFDAVAPWVSAADYAVVNLETPVAGPKYSGYPCFNAPDSYVDALTAAGFDMMLTANNHTLDRRDRGVRATIKTLDAKGVDHIGTYTDAEARAKALPYIKDIKGFKVGFLNYTYGTNGIRISGNVVVDYIDRKAIDEDIRKTREAGAEILVVAIHWGDEYKLLPNAYQRSMANFLKERGVDLVIGGHPHVIQPMELAPNEDNDGRNTLLVYSLGNFISNMKTTDTRGGAMVRATIKRDVGGRAYVADAGYRLVFTVQPTGRGQNFRLVPVDADTDIDSVAGSRAAACKAFVSSSLRIFDKHNRNVGRIR